jgi:DNA ligase-1
MKLPTLYKRTSTGKIQTWTIEVVNDQYRTISGQLDGSQVVSEWTLAKAKNVGRANETTPEEQAVREAQSKWDRKNEKDYHTSIEAVDTAKIYTPMLAHKWCDHHHKMPELIWFSPKLDGLRVVITKNGCTSRTGKPFPALDFFVELLSPVFDKHPDAILDGEAYNHDLKDNFNKIISLCRKTKPSQIEAAKEEIQAGVYPVLFDVPRIGDFDETSAFMKRWLILKNTGLDTKYLVEYTPAGRDRLDQLHEQYVLDGYEGLMARDPKAPYENKRSYTLLKYKEFIDAEFEILDVVEGDGNRSGMMGRVVLANVDGSTFDANSRGDVDFYTDMLLNKEQYIGKLATVRYQNLTPDGVPRFGVIHSTRDYE